MTSPISPAIHYGERAAALWDQTNHFGSRDCICKAQLYISVIFFFFSVVNRLLCIVWNRGRNLRRCLDGNWYSNHCTDSSLSAASYPADCPIDYRIDGYWCCTKSKAAKSSACCFLVYIHGEDAGRSQAANLLGMSAFTRCSSQVLHNVSPTYNTWHGAS